MISLILLGTKTITWSLKILRIKITHELKFKDQQCTLTMIVQTMMH